MLDTGQAFFCMMALGTGLRARNSAVWWLASGGAAGFGCLQKSPLSAAFFLLAIVVVVLGDRATARKQLRFIAGGVALLVLLALLWPGIQGLRHGWTSFRTIYGTEIADRFLEHRAIISAPRSAYLSTYFGGWRMAGVAALGSLIAVFARARLRCNPAALGVAVAAAVYIALLPLAQPVYPRYLLALTPLLAVLMGGVTTGLPMTPRLRLILLGFVLFMSFPDISATVRVGSDKVKARRDLIEIVQLIKGSPQQGKRIRIVALEDDTTRSDYLSNAVLFYGEIPRGILKIEESSRRRIWPQAARGWTCYLIAPNSNSIRRGQGSAVWERVGKNASYTLWKMAF
jgi:hypothetical protein